MVICTGILGATAGWALAKLNREYMWMSVVFAVFIAHTLVGLLTFVGVLGKVPLFLHTAFIAEVIHIPFLNAELYKQMGMPKVAYAHAASCLMPFLSLYILWDRRPALTDLFDILNTASLVYLAVSTNNEWCGFIVLNHIVFRMYGYYSALRLSLLSLGLSIFNILAVSCLMNPPTQGTQT